MAGTSRFHDKLHRANHHSVTTPGLPDSAYDPIASMDYPFRGDFVLSGALSALNDASVNSLTTRKNLTVNEIAQFQGPVYTNNTGSVVTTNSYPVTSNNGPATLTFNYNNGVYINGTYGSIPKLIIGVPGVDAGIVSVTNVDATSGRLTSLTVSSAVGIGTTSPQHSLHVVGDVIIYGTLTANGNSYFQNTLFSTTSSLSIVNTGTGAGLTVSQEGNQPIVAFYDHESSISLWADGDAARPGWVGVKTHTPNVEFTVSGDISSSGKIYSAISDSDQWSASYTSAVANSGRWESNYTSTNTNSGKWQSVYTTTSANSGLWAANYTTTNTKSASWDAGYTVSNTKSASWDSSYTTVLANSATWGSGGTTSSVVVANSAKWNANYTTTNLNSGSWVANYTTTNTKSASWDSSYTTVLANSASWSAGGGGAGAVYSTVNAFSANWNNSYNTLTSSSANWNNSYNTLTTASASWSSVYNTTTANSASWNAGGAVSSTVVSNSARWNSTYNTTSANSGNWDSSYVTLLANSATWDSAAGALVDIDLDYLADVSITTNTLADGQLLTYDIGTQQWENTSLLLSGFVQGHTVWESTFSTTNSNSANWNTGHTAYTTITANSATWSTSSLSGSTDVVITSPANNALLQYNTATGKWIDGDTLITTNTLTAGSIDLTTAEISTYETELSASGDFLLLRINGVVRKLRLWD